jgi:hypothetical protein
MWTHLAALLLDAPDTTVQEWGVADLNWGFSFFIFALVVLLVVGAAVGILLIVLANNKKKARAAARGGSVRHA